MIPKRGEVWRADLGAGKVRPVVIVSRDDSNPPRVLTTYAPITTQNRGSSYEVPLPHVRFLKDGNVVNVQGLGSGDSNDPSLFLDKMGDLYPSVMEKVDEALRFALGIPDNSQKQVPGSTPQSC